MKVTHWIKYFKNTVLFLKLSDANILQKVEQMFLT